MENFILLFRMDILTPDSQPTSEQMKSYMADWYSWIESIEAKGKLAPGGNHLSREGRVLHSDQTIAESPYAVKNESVAGYILILADDFEDAVNIAQKCPIINGEGNSVEVRRIASA